MIESLLATLAIVVIAGAAWPYFLALRLERDAGHLSRPRSKLLPKPYQKLVKKLAPQAGKRLPRSGQESGLYE